MRIDEETTFSLRVSWQPVDPRNVRHYRLSYISAEGDRAEETVRLTDDHFYCTYTVRPHIPINSRRILEMDLKENFP